MKAELVYRFKRILSDGAILEMVFWKLPHPVPGSRHDYKYRLYYGHDGRRLVGYDNERGKGDHRHLDGNEQAYPFSTVDRLIADFLEDVRNRRQTT